LKWVSRRLRGLPAQGGPTTRGQTIRMLICVLVVLAASVTALGHEPCPVQSAHEFVHYEAQATAPPAYSEETQIPTSFLPKCNCDCCIVQERCDQKFCRVHKGPKCNSWLDANFMPLHCDVTKVWEIFQKRPRNVKDMHHDEFCREFCYSESDDVDTQCLLKPVPGVYVPKKCPCKEKITLKESAADDTEQIREQIVKFMNSDLSLSRDTKIDGKVLPKKSVLENLTGAFQGLTDPSDVLTMPKGAVLVFRKPEPMLGFLQVNRTRGSAEEHEQCCHSK